MIINYNKSYFGMIETLAIIPARGGSKAIKNKNIINLGGKPLIYYTIIEAQKSKLISRLVLNTDNKKIAGVGKNFGVEVPFLRPKKFAKDDSPLDDLIKHTLSFFKNKECYEPKIIIILQPTQPFRNTRLIDKSIRMLEKSKASSVISVAKITQHPYASFWYKTNFLKPFRTDFKKFYQRQKVPDLYFPTGEVYVFWAKNLKKFGNFYGPKIKPLIRNEDHITDINLPIDLFYAEMRKKYLERPKN
tara:strand:+ start:145 stop:882 length:738 start_codon:yes stop_codon:yes gene_type:complete